MIVLTDERISAECENALIERGFEVIKLPPYELLDTPVASHPDMLVFVGKGTLICHEKYYAIAKDKIDRAVSSSGLRLKLSDEEWGGKYPRDVLFNAAAVGDRIICNKKCVSELITELYGEENVINVRQGYAKCATVVVSDSGVITADKSVSRAAREAGIDVLELSEHYTLLDGYDGGFVGGASGDDGRHVFFTGSLALHREGKEIREFCKKHGREAVSLAFKLFYDYGTLIFI